MVSCIWISSVYGDENSMKSEGNCFPSGRKWFLKRREKSRERPIPFDPDRQYAVIRSSICTGEKVAGFREINGDHFTEVMLIRSRQDEEKFKETYHLSAVKTEY